MSDRVGLGLLNMLLQTASGDPVGELEYTKLVKQVPSRATPDEAVRSLLEALGPRGAKVLKAAGRPAATAAASSSPPPAGKPAASPGKLAARAKFEAAAAAAEPGPAPRAAASPASPAKAAGSPASPARGGFGAQSLACINRAKLEEAETEVCGGWDGPAMYLTYEPTQAGIMYCVYSKTPVSHALAYARPGKPIPGFKFNTLGGKTELVKGASDKQVFMRGIAAFVKAAKAHQGSVDIKETAGLYPVAVYIHYTAGNKVARVAPGGLTATDGLDAVACVPQANADLKGIAVLDKALFVQRGDSCGGTAS